MYRRRVRDTDLCEANFNKLYLGQLANPVDVVYGQVEEDCEFYYRSDDGKDVVIARLVNLALSEKLIAETAKWTSTVKGDGGNAGKIIAPGAMMSRERKDGSFGFTKEVPQSIRDALAKRGWERNHLGWVDRDVRNGDCRPWSWSLERPDIHAAAEPLVKAVSLVFKEEVPEPYGRQAEFMRHVHPHFKFPESIYSDCTVNRNVRTAGHYDDKDFRGGLGNLIVIAGGGEHGGAILLPRWGIALNPRPTAVLFMNVHDLHCNLPFVGERQTVVLYTREHLDQCGR